MREARAADAANEAAGPFFGWLCNRLPGYPDTLNLKTHVHVLPDRVARIELEPTDHPLAIEQRDGITRTASSRSSPPCCTLRHLAKHPKVLGANDD